MAAGCSFWINIQHHPMLQVLCPHQALPFSTGTLSAWDSRLGEVHGSLGGETNYQLSQILQ